MVLSHARKSQIRALVEASSGTLSYSQAAKRAQALAVSDNYWCDWRSSLSEDEISLAHRAAATLETGRDLVIFGKAGSGKSTVVHAVLSAAKTQRKIALEPRYLPFGHRSPVGDSKGDHRLLRGLDLAYDWAVAGESVELIALDEFDLSRSPMPSNTSRSQLIRRIESTPQRMLVVHSSDLERAKEKLLRILSGVALKDPVFIEALTDPREIGASEYDSAGKWITPKRSYRISEFS